jgi:hypothetical protein
MHHSHIFGHILHILVLAAIAAGFFWLGRRWPSGPGGGTKA